MDAQMHHRVATTTSCAFYHLRVSRSELFVVVPSIDPPVREEEGSTAKTATRWPFAIKNMPKVSIKELFPTPGAPESPILKEQGFVIDNK